MEPSEPIRRAVARVLLLDNADRLLLLPDTDPEWGGYWYPPGGRIEEGETPRRAAERELLEEIGIAADIGPAIFRYRARFMYGGRRLDQHEWYFVARTPNAVGLSSRRGDNEAANVAAHRWWSLLDIASSEERLFPDGLAEIMRRLLENGPPSQPWTPTSLRRKAQSR